MALRINFTDANVADLEIKEDRYVAYDSKLPGLCVRVEPSSRKTFYFVYSIRRRVRWYKIGHVAMGTAAAKIMAKELIGITAARGRDPQAERRAGRGGVTFAQLQQRHLAEFAKTHNKGWKQPDYLIRKYVLPRWADLRAVEITRGHVKALFGQLSINRKPLANQVKAAISAVFSFGVTEEIVEKNPCAKVRDNPSSSRDRVLSNSELPLFWAACNNVHPVRAAALKAILLSGARPGEISHMRREHIRDGCWWELPGKPVPELGWPGTKNAASHRVFLSAKVREIIGEGTTGFVFANERGNAVSDLAEAMREISRACAFDPPVTPHDLRRSAGTLITGRGHGREAMNRVLNHRKKGVSEIYDRHDYATADKIIMEDLSVAIMEAIEGKERDNVVAGEFRKAR
jgi:integrase